MLSVTNEDVRKYLQKQWDKVERFTERGASDELVGNAIDRYCACERMAKELFGVVCDEKDGHVYIVE